MNWNFDDLTSWLAIPVMQIGQRSLTLGNLVLAFILSLVVWRVSSSVERILHRRAKRYVDEPWKHSRFLMMSRFVRYAIWIIGTLMVLNHLGIDLSSITLLGSALAVGLGFGLQNIVSNFVSGVIILLEQSLKVGDYIELSSGTRGHVREIAMRYTLVTTNEQLDVLVPNSEFINGQVINWTHENHFRRMHIGFGVAYGTDKSLVYEAGIEAAQNIQGVIHQGTKTTDVWLKNYGDSAVEYELVVWLDRKLTQVPLETHARLMWALDDALAKRNIEIPFPQRDLNVRSGVLDVRMQPPVPTDSDA